MKYYEPIHDGFVRFCSIRAHGLMDTDDLVQESVASAFEKFEKIENKQALLAYLMRTASNIVGSKRRRAKFSSPKDIDTLAFIRAHVDDPGLAFDIAELYKALNKLGDKQREAVILFEISGYSMKEIAEIQESSVGAVKVRIHRGREKLKELLVNHDELSLQEVLKAIIAIAVV